MTSFGPWLKPTLLGPLLTSWGYMSLGIWLLGVATITGGHLDDWLIAMLWASAFGCMLGVTSIAVDVALLAAKMRSLPTGVRAWLTSLLAPVGVIFIWQLPIWNPPESVLALVVLLVAPMFVSPLLLRLAFGTKP